MLTKLYKNHISPTFLLFKILGCYIRCRPRLRRLAFVSGLAIALVLLFGGHTLVSDITLVLISNLAVAAATRCASGLIPFCCMKPSTKP
jgi:hypothetical protein